MCSAHNGSTWWIKSCFLSLITGAYLTLSLVLNILQRSREKWFCSHVEEDVHKSNQGFTWWTSCSPFERSNILLKTVPYPSAKYGHYCVFFSDADICKRTLVCGQLTDAIKSNKLKQTSDFLYAVVVLICKYMQYKVILIVPIRSFSLLDGLSYKLAEESPHTRDHVTSLVRTISHDVSATARRKTQRF